MVKAYLRYVQEASWGVIVSGGGQVVVDPTGKLAITPALDTVLVWDIKTQSIVHRLVPPGGRPGESSEVTALALASDGDTLAAGHANGTIHLWRLSDVEERTVLTGHRSAVTALHFNGASTLLASGSHDTNVVVWDVVGEAGVCRLRGHRDAVTDVCLLPGRKALASVSKDGSLRLWDLDMQHCVQTALSPSGELWSVAAEAGWLFTGGAAGEVLAWRLEQASVIDGPRAPATAQGAGKALTGGEGEGGEGESGEGEGGEGVAWEAAHVTLFGPLATKSSNRAARLRMAPDGASLGCQYADRTVQLWSIQSEAQLKRQRKRRLEKGKRKRKEADEAEAAEELGTELSASDHFVHLGEVKASAKLHSFAFMPSRSSDGGEAAAAADDEAGEKAAVTRVARLLVATRNNALSVYEMPTGHGGRGASGSLAASVLWAGHRTEARGLALSSDDRMLLTGSDGEAKVWSLKTQQCLRTLPCGYALCVSFLCSSRFVAVGTKAGLIQLFSFATGEQLAQLEAHAGAIWSLQLEPGAGANALLSASADKTIATWTPLEGGEGGAALSLERERSHDVGDDAMCACYSSDAKHLAVGLLDATVKVLFVDTFKQYLTLFGHKLPVLAVSISSDGSLLASASADKTVKIWGMDFGDCHRSLLAHSEPVTSVAFVRDTHYFFSAAKDKLVKFWDGDRFEQILSLPGHHAEVSGLVLTRRGDGVLTCSRDRSLRLWRRTDEQVFVEEERENELEQLFEAGLERQQPSADAEEEAVGAGLSSGAAAEAAGAGRRSAESVKGAERVLEALRVLREEAARRDEHAQAVRVWESRAQAAATLGGSTALAQGPGKRPVFVTNLLLLGLSEGAFLLKALAQVRGAELEQALLLLPYAAACELLERLLPLLEEAPPAELMTRCVLFVLKVHHKQLVAHAAMATPLHRLDAALHGRLRRERDVLGYNLAALGMLKRFVEERDATSLFDEALAAKDGAEQVSTAERQRATIAQQGKAGGGKPGGNPKKKRRAVEIGGRPKPV